MPLYFIATTVYFWVPLLVLGLLVLPKRSRLEKKAFWLSLALFYPLMFGLEYFYLHFDIWTFSEAKDPLLGLRIWGVPIEEFWFWYGAIPFVMLVYWGFCDVLKRKRIHA